MDYEAARARVDALNDLAWAGRQDNSGKALSWCEEAGALAREAGYLDGLGRSLYVRGTCQLRLANPEAALDDAAAALRHFETSGNQPETEEVLKLLGMVQSVRGEFGAALGYFLSCYKLCRGRGDAREALALNNLGYIQDYLGDYAESLTYYLQGWEVVGVSADKAEGHTLLINIGWAYYRLGQYHDALNYYAQGLAVDACDPRNRALLLDNSSLAYEKLGDVEKALSYQQQSLSLRESIRDKRGVGESLDGLGSLYTTLGDARAQGYLERALTTKRETGDRKGEAETCILLGELFIQKRRFKRALGFLHTALETAAAIGSKENVYRAHGALAEAYQLKGQLRLVLEHQAKYHTLKDELLGEVASQKLQNLRVRFETERAERERELYRLKNVELARALAELEVTAQSLREADAQKTLLMAQLEKHAHEDLLTGLANRRYFTGRLAHELGRAHRFGSTLSVALCDIDDFKGVNDRFSHALGDEVLRTVAALFKNNSRVVDTVARYGGEEFMVLLPETSAPEAAIVCQKVRRAVVTHPWHKLHQGLEVTLSIGIADDTAVADYEALIALADAKLYEAKRNGKNQVRY